MIKKRAVCILETIVFCNYSRTKRGHIQHALMDVLRNIFRQRAK